MKHLNFRIHVILGGLTYLVSEVDEAVLEDALALVNPEVDEGARILAVFRRDRKHALENFGKVTKIEGIVRLGRRRQHRLQQPFVHFNRRVDGSDAQQLSISRISALQLSAGTTQSKGIYWCAIRGLPRPQKHLRNPTQPWTLAPGPRPQR